VRDIGNTFDFERRVESLGLVPTNNTTRTPRSIRATDHRNGIPGERVRGRKDGVIFLQLHDLDRAVNRIDKTMLTHRRPC